MQKLPLETLEDLSKVSPPEKYGSLKEILENGNKFDRIIKRPTHLNWLEKVAKGKFEFFYSSKI